MDLIGKTWLWLWATIVIGAVMVTEILGQFTPVVSLVFLVLAAVTTGHVIYMIYVAYKASNLDVLSPFRHLVWLLRNKRSEKRKKKKVFFHGEQWRKLLRTRDLNNSQQFGDDWYILREENTEDILMYNQKYQLIVSGDGDKIQANNQEALKTVPLEKLHQKWCELIREVNSHE